jgi:hypothetical protein
MKSIQSFSLIIGFCLGLIVCGLSPMVQKTFAQDEKKDGMTAEEIDKHLDEIIEGQTQLKKKIEAITTQTQFLKASSGK